MISTTLCAVMGSLIATACHGSSATTSALPRLPSALLANTGSWLFLGIQMRALAAAAGHGSYPRSAMGIRPRHGDIFWSLSRHHDLGGSRSLFPAVAGEPTGHGSYPLCYKCCQKPLAARGGLSSFARVANAGTGYGRWSWVLPTFCSGHTPAPRKSIWNLSRLQDLGGYDNCSSLSLASPLAMGPTHSCSPQPAPQRPYGDGRRPLAPVLRVCPRLAGVQGFLSRSGQAGPPRWRLGWRIP